MFANGKLKWKRLVFRYILDAHLCRQMALRTPDIHLSASNEFDKLLHQVNLIAMNQSHQDKMELDFLNVPDVSAIVPEAQFSPVK